MISTDDQENNSVLNLGPESWSIGILNKERLFLTLSMQPPKMWMTHMQLLRALTDDHIDVNYRQSFQRAIVTMKKPQHGGE